MAKRLAAEPAPTDLRERLAAVNALFPRRINAYDLSEEQTAALDSLVALAKAGDRKAFDSQATAFFNDVTGGIYPIEDGKIDYYEFTAIYAAGTYDTTTKHAGKRIPMITTPASGSSSRVCTGNGMLGMVDYISSAGYYGLMPMMNYEYGGGKSYNSIHNTGISNWIQGHPLLPTEWREYTEGSRNGKPFNRVALTSRGPVSHGCTRINSGHLAEFREYLPSTSEADGGRRQLPRDLALLRRLRSPRRWRRRGHGRAVLLRVPAYERARREADLAQNNRKDFYEWLYGDEMNYGPIGEVTFDEVCEPRFEKRKTKEGRKWQNLTLYEAPYQPETLQLYTINGVESKSNEGMDFNRELRRVGHGYEVDRKLLRLE